MSWFWAAFGYPILHPREWGERAYRVVSLPVWIFLVFNDLLMASVSASVGFWPTCFLGVLYTPSSMFATWYAFEEKHNDDDDDGDHFAWLH